MITQPEENPRYREAPPLTREKIRDMAEKAREHMKAWPDWLKDYLGVHV